MCCVGSLYFFFVVVVGGRCSCSCCQICCFTDIDIFVFIVSLINPGLVRDRRIREREVY